MSTVLKNKFKKIFKGKKCWIQVSMPSLTLGTL